MFQFTAIVSLIDRDTNFCVYVPKEITDLLIPSKGSIYVEGFINNAAFTKNLRRYKGQPWHLYINIPTLKAAGARPGDEVNVRFEQKHAPAKIRFDLEPMLAKRLTEENLVDHFSKITPGRQQAILRYLNQINSDSLREIWVERIIYRLLQGDTRFIIPYKIN